MAWLVVWFCGRFGWLSVWLVSWLVGLFGCVVGGLVDWWDCLLVAYSGQLIGLLYNGLGIDFMGERTQLEMVVCKTLLRNCISCFPYSNSSLFNR